MTHLKQQRICIMFCFNQRG